MENGEPAVNLVQTILDDMFTDLSQSAEFTPRLVRLLHELAHGGEMGAASKIRAAILTKSMDNNEAH